MRRFWLSFLIVLLPTFVVLSAVSVSAKTHHRHHHAPPAAVVYCGRFCSAPLPCATIIPTAQPVLGPGGAITGYQCPVPPQ